MSGGKVLRVGMVGAGWVTQHHLLAWQKLSGIKVVAICDLNVDHARKHAQADCLSSDKPFETVHEDNLKTLKIVEDIYQYSDKFA